MKAVRGHVMNDDTQEKEFDFFRAPEPVAIKQTPSFQVWLAIGLFFWILVLSVWASISIPILLLRGGNPTYITTIEKNIGHDSELQLELTKICSTKPEGVSHHE